LDFFQMKRGKAEESRAVDLISMKKRSMK